MNPEDRQPDAFRAEETAPAQTPTYAYVILHPDGTVQCLLNYDRQIYVENLPAEWGANDPQLFEPAQIKHGPIASSDRHEPRNVNILMPTTDERVRRFLVTAAPILLRVYILRLNSAAIADGSTNIDYLQHAQIVESGILGKFGFSNNTIAAELTPEPYFHQGEVPRHYFSRRCNHVLFSEGCGLDRNDAAFIYSTTIASLNAAQREVVITGQKGGAAADFFSAGQVAVTDLGLNFTVGWSSFDGGNTKLKLTTWHPELAVGLDVVARAGCLHTPAACAAFDNSANYGGFPHIPNRNPAVNSVNA